ncbi:DUF3993 domain-containing protein [Bacillus infantis]|uniref:DUF3993 domain-containing protein n=1 Tax=Bacillus infantis TaxID=324767 RepID=UPI001CD766D3|nr:DUF3993 domain-containing protein [Bacillus infantis]MCA1040994.1 DUF3993 domain-containing protein [Bacillus infantis]
MYIKWANILLAAVILAVMLPMAGAKAAEDHVLENRGEVLEFLESAFEAQTSLSEEPRSLEEIEAVLDPYFTDSYASLFLQENLSEEGEGNIIYGTDFGLYYIPFFEFTEETKVIIDSEKILVFEYFPGMNEGPAAYPGHYEGIRIEKTDSGWKVAEWLYDEAPRNILSSATSDLVYKGYNDRAGFSREADNLKPMAGSGLQVPGLSLNGGEGLLLMEA